MQKKLFSINLLIGILLITTFYIIVEANNFVLYMSAISLYTSASTAIYTILAQPNLNKTKKQNLYGQLKKAILIIISRLEGKYYQDIHFRLWKNIRQDDRYHLFDKKLREQLDIFLEKIKKYSKTINELDNNIIPEIIDDAIINVFNVDRSSFDKITIYINLTIKNRPRFQTSISELGQHMKKNQSLTDIIHQKAKTNSIEIDEIELIQMLIPLPNFDVNDDTKITKFWNTCLIKIENVPKLKFVVEENESLLKEAKKIKKTLIKRIKKTIKN